VGPPENAGRGRERESRGGRGEGGPALSSPTSGREATEQHSIQAKRPNGGGEDKPADQEEGGKGGNPARPTRHAQHRGKRAQQTIITGTSPRFLVDEGAVNRRCRPQRKISGTSEGLTR